MDGPEVDDPHPASAGLVYADVTHLGLALSTGETTSAALTEACLARIATLDRAGPRLHSVLVLDQAAMDVARERDAERAAGRVRGPLHGIPVLVKDNLDTAGLASTAGSLALATAPPVRDAFAVRRLRAAGAIVLGKTNLSEWANFRSTRSASGWSAVGGQTRNPFALDRSPSGSSSGSGAAVAAGLAPLAVGTETDGSILSPAAVAGLVGMKPTVGLVSREGVVPVAASQDTPGPLARSVAGAAALLGVLAGADPQDPASARRPADLPADYLPFCRPDGLAGLRIGVPRCAENPRPRFRFSGYHAASDAVFADGLAALRLAGATVVEDVEVPGAEEEAEPDDELVVLCHEFHAGLDAYLAARAAAVGGGPRSLVDVIEFNEAHADVELALFDQDLLERAAATGGLDDGAYRAARERCDGCSRARGIDWALDAGGLDALAVLTTSPAWLVDHVIGDTFLGAGYSIAAVAGYPSITVPIGAVHGLPVGLTFLGRAWSEGVLLSAAAGLEAALGPAPRPRYLPVSTLA
ncbi:MAG: amidase [Acidimicrobiales bacterium]|jgi:amidase